MSRPLARAALPADRLHGDSLLAKALLVVAGSALLWVSAKVQVPFYPVPMTMQTFVVVMLGMTLGWRLGAGAVLLYLAEGAAGLPVFAGTPERGLGLAYMVGPTGGYLVGFLLAAATAGWLAERGLGRTVLGTLVTVAVGIALIYALGLLWLSALVGWGTPVLSLGLTPFLVGEAFKLALAAAVLPPLCRRAVRR